MEPGNLVKVKRYGNICGDCGKRSKVGGRADKKFYCSKCRPQLMPAEKFKSKKTPRDVDYYHALVKHLGINQNEEHYVAWIKAST